VIKDDIMEALRVIQEGDGRKLHLLNLAFLILIPKKPDVVEVKDFRPISIVHSFAKLVTKILANRLAPRLNSLVSTNQSAFIRGRCIHDNFLLVQQMARFLHNRREPRLLLKLDITMAFDSVSWPFLLEVMSHLGFGRRWREIICCCFAQLPPGYCSMDNRGSGSLIGGDFARGTRCRPCSSSSSWMC
jgi:hypothetical protein